MSPLNGSRGAWIAPPESRLNRAYAPVGTTMERYSLPFFDLPGITTVKDLGDPQKARAMGQAMYDRHSRGDVASNLSITTLVTNAFLVSGEEKYRDWVVEYTGAWMRRAEENGGLIPDNVGLSGEVGEYCNGNWYGGLYGWTWPHGFATLIAAAFDAGANAFLLTRDSSYLDLPRSQIDRMLELGELRRDDARDTLGPGQSSGDPSGGGETFMVPLRYGDAGWFDWAPPSPVWPISLWNLSMAEEDWSRIEEMRAKSGGDWNGVSAFHGKTDGGHEAPWVRFLAGANPDYPERILHATEQIARRRLALVREDESVGTRHHVHHWQWANPVSSEALVQLTLGAPQQVYNGGLLHARLRYFDAQQRRPGLPPGVAALVEELEAERTVVRLVNLGGTETRELILPGRRLRRAPVRHREEPRPHQRVAGTVGRVRRHFLAADDGTGRTPHRGELDPLRRHPASRDGDHPRHGYRPLRGYPCLFQRAVLTCSHDRIREIPLRPQRLHPRPRRPDPGAGRSDERGDRPPPRPDPHPHPRAGPRRQPRGAGGAGC